MQIGLIRVVTQEDPVEIHRHGALLEGAFPGFRVLSRCIEDQPKGIYDAESERLAVPKILQLAQTLVEGDGVDALILSCAADPGVEELRRLVPVPVIGAGESVAALARTLGSAVGVLTITEEVPGPIQHVLGERYRAMARVKGTETTLDLREPAILQRALQSGQRLKEQGCNVIALACTGFSTIGLAPHLQRALSVPVVDPVLACGAALYPLSLMRGWKA